MRKAILTLLIVGLFPRCAGMAATIKEPVAPKANPAPTAPYKTTGQVETIRGSLMALVREQRLIVLKGEGGVPYNFKVTPATKIEIGGKKAGFEELDTVVTSNISVTFVPMRQGNLARKIQVLQ
jgi:hypothetical protein